MRNVQKSYILLVFGFFFLSGCGTVPVKKGLPTYNLHGTRYVPLVSLCAPKHIEVDFDTFSRLVSLRSDLHRVNLRIGDTLILVDGAAQHLRHPVDIYQGTVVVPYRFKEQIIDTLFKGAAPIVKTCPLPIKIKKIVIDAGHGGNDPGAVGRTGLREKDVNLDIAKRLEQLFKKEGFEVVLTRNTDSFVSLERRVDAANSSGADLFLSVHSNANRLRSLNGFEVYYVSPTVSDTQRATSAAHTGALRSSIGTSAYLTATTKAILWDLIYAYSRAEAIVLSRAICDSIAKNLDVEILGVKTARFYVLKGVRMPAVLIEVGFVSNKTEEQYLKNYFYRQKIAEGIKEGVVHYAQEITLAESRAK